MKSGAMRDAERQRDVSISFSYRELGRVTRMIDRFRCSSDMLRIQGAAFVFIALFLQNVVHRCTQCISIKSDYVRSHGNSHCIRIERRRTNPYRVTARSLV